MQENILYCVSTGMWIEYTKTVFENACMWMVYEKGSCVS